MKARFLWLAAVMTLALPAGASAHSLQGLWLVQEGDATVRIEVYRGALCGRIVWVRDSLYQGQLRRDRKNPDPALRDRVMRDLVIVSELAATSADSTRWRSATFARIVTSS